MTPVAEGESLRIETVSRGRVSYVRLFGPIDETFDVDEILAQSSGLDLIINANSVSRISSFGVRQWVNGMTRLAAAKNRILLYDCSPVMVKQINLVSNFIEHCDVVSIQAPYFCKACGLELALEQEVTAQGVSVPTEPVKCRRCGSPMDLDEDPASYYRFARPDRFRPIERHIQEFIASYVRGPAADKTAKDDPGKLGPVLYHLRRLVRDRRVLGAAVGSLLVVIAAAAWLQKPPGKVGIPPEGLQRYTALVQKWEFDAAAALLTQMASQGAVPPDLAESMHAQLRQQRELARENNIATARRSFAAKEFEEVVNQLLAAERAAVLPAAAEYMLAESYRRLERPADAESRYGRFCELVGEEGDPRFDDALYWRGEALIKLGRNDEARPLLVKVIELKSNFRRSAKRMLQDLD